MCVLKIVKLNFSLIRKVWIEFLYKRTFILLGYERCVEYKEINKNLKYGIKNKEINRNLKYGDTKIKKFGCSFRVRII